MRKRVDIKDYLFFQEGPGVRNTQYTTNGVKLLNVSNLVGGEIDLSNSDRYISKEEAYGKYKHFLVDEGDLIIASSGIKVEYLDKKIGFIKKEHLPLCMNTSTIRFKTLDHDKLNIDYFKYYLQSIDFKKQVQKSITGSAQLNYGPSHLKKMTFIIDDIDKQIEVVKVLNRILAIIKKHEGILDKFDTLIKARFVEMFGDPVSNHKMLKEKKLSELGVLGRGVSKHRPRNAPELMGGKYPLIQTGDVANADLYIDSYNETYSELGLKQSKMWSKGTLCITIAANIANTGILAFDACFPDSVVGFNAKNEVDNIFVHYWFKFFQSVLEAQAPAVAQKNINLQMLNELKVIVPNKDDIDGFNDFVHHIDKLKFA